MEGNARPPVPSPGARHEPGGSFRGVQIVSPEVKLRMLAKADTTLQEFFGGPSDLFRWFDTQLLPGYISRGTCARVLRVSTVFLQAHGTSDRRSLLDMEQPRFQIDVLDFDPER